MSLEIIKEIHKDARGFLATFPFVSAQCNVSFNHHTGTLRGLHYREPAEEKIVLCTKGSIYDVVVDLETGEWVPKIIPSSEIRYVGKGFAHGFQTLEDDTEIFYAVSETYDPERSRGIKYDSFGIKWPLPVTSISEKDDALPSL